jgi:mono/diheme cytochrome c family protein
MLMRHQVDVLVMTLALVACLPARGDAPPDADRGREALLTRCYSAPFVSRSGYENLWKQWGLKERPADFDAQVRTRYGLHEAPYPNEGLPMGLRMRPDNRVGIDCMLCHGGSLFGRSYVGLPNTSLDLVGLFTDLDRANGAFGIFPYRVSNVRGTTESTATGIFVLSLRDPDLKLSLPPANLGPMPDQACEDAPPWWHLKRKGTMYYNGQIDARAVRPLMMFMLSPGADGSKFDRLEPTFADIREHITTIEPPKYPLPVDAEKASLGRVVFEANCAGCHGTYGAASTDPRANYPNKIVPLAKIGTDPTLIRGLTPAIEQHFRNSWFTREPGPGGKPYPLRYNEGYQAPPLDGIWATAPYLHNGSVPTLYHLLKSTGRPRVFTRSYGTGVEDYDPRRVGWKFTEVPPAPPTASAREARQIYDTSKPGRGNGGHTFGDDLSDEERWAVIEYLKTL